MSQMGAKQICLKCNTPFYDLGKKNPACPKCGNILVIESSNKSEPLIELVKNDKDDDLRKKQEIDDVGDIDLTEFNADNGEKLEGVDEGITSIEDINELEDDIDEISELENREVSDDRINSDDSDDELAIEEMDNVESLIDRIDGER